MIFETGRLIVRPWTQDDLEDGFAIYSDPKVMQFLARDPARDMAEMQERLNSLLDMYGGEKARPFGFWAAELKETGRVIGSSVLKPLPGDERVEVGWHLSSKFWGRGFATEMGRGAVEYGFQEQGLDAIYAITMPENAPSRAVCERLGMRFTGFTDRYHNLTLTFYELLRAI